MKFNRPDPPYDAYQQWSSICSEMTWGRSGSSCRLGGPQPGFLRMDEKRASQRKRVLKAGTVEFHGGGIDFVIRNLSDTGAALEVESVVGVPAEFTLVIRAEDFSRKCRVVRRETKRLGVKLE